MGRKKGRRERHPAWRYDGFDSRLHRYVPMPSPQAYLPPQGARGVTLANWVKRKMRDIDDRLYDMKMQCLVTIRCAPDSEKEVDFPKKFGQVREVFEAALKEGKVQLPQKGTFVRYLIKNSLEGDGEAVQV